MTFTICISFPSKYQKDVEAALWAWETFGGIGARTRRGFGALQLVRVNGQPELLPKQQDAKRKIEEQLKQHVVEGTWIEGVPYLLRDVSDDWLVVKFKDKPFEVWRSLSDRLKRFRQQRRDKNTHRLNNYGNWPEPNAIRRRAKHKPRGPHKERNIDAAPRGSFGLPIVFHMAHDTNMDQILQIDAKRDRFASPLILKPLACSDGAVGLAVILQGTKVPEKLYLKGVNQSITRTISEDEARQIAVLNGETDVLKAFLRFLQQNNK